MTDLVQGGMFSVMVVRVDDPSDPNFEGQLAEHVARSSAFFANAPVVLDIERCEGLATVDQFQRLKALFKRQHMVAIGVQHGNRTQVRAAMNADLACFPPASVQRRAEGVDQPAPRPAAPVASSGPAVPKAPPPPGGGRTKLVTQPVRSGTQVYARGGDLVVTNQVGAGAEVIADGHLHIYGVLRGRAIAGATGDREARIFVDRLEAELVCIAGHYLVSDAIAEQHRGKAVQIALVADQLVITPA